MELVIETTRRCNLLCVHCLRGCAENVDIRNEYTTSMLRQIKDIGLSFSVTFTGGEPSLNTPAISHYIAECKRLNIAHSSFYIATNGAGAFNTDFFVVCCGLYAIAEDKDSCSVQLSNDQFHIGENEEKGEVGLFDALKFFSMRQENGRVKEEYLISEGAAADNGYGNRCNDEREILDLDGFEQARIYLNAEGVIINGCDWSYESQRENEEIQLCLVDDFTEWYSKIEKGNENNE